MPLDSAFRPDSDAIDPAAVPQHTLSGSGSRADATMPVIGMGTFGSDHASPDEVAQAVRGALNVGYRHIDCAAVYGNEREIGAVLAGVTLTIMPGVTVKAANTQALVVQGTLEAPGTEALPITFTSSADTGAYQWAGLAFDGGSGTLAYATVRYAGDNNPVSDSVLSTNDRAAVTARNAVVALDHTTVRDISGDLWEYGLVVADSDVTLTNSLFTGIGGGNYAQQDVPIALKGGQTRLEMTDSVLSGNTGDRILLLPGAMMGYADPVLPAGAQMDGYEFREDFTVPAAVTLTIEPGVTVLSGLGGWNIPHDLVIEGRLIAQGTEAEPITFTSVADSGTGQWNGLSFDGRAGGPAEGQLAHVVIRNAGLLNRVTNAALDGYSVAALTGLRANLTMDDVTISDVQTNSWDKGLLLRDSRAAIDHSVFARIGNGGKDNTVSADAPIHVIGAVTEWVLGDNLYTDNSPDMIKVTPGALTASDFTLFYQEGLDGYLFQDDFVVPLGITMTLEPGVSYRGDDEDELRIEGSLVALGTQERPILFTSYEDSGPVQWSGLVFDGTAGEGSGNLLHATVRNAGHGNSVLPNNPFDHSFYASNITARNVLTGTLELKQTVVENVFHFDGWHHFSDAGLYLYNSRALLDGVTFRNTGDRPADDDAIRVFGDSHLVVRDSSIESNSGTGIEVVGDTAFVHVTGSRIVNNLSDGVANNGAATVILGAAEADGNSIQSNHGYGAAQIGISGEIMATYNWWGDASGPTHSGNPGGSGEDVTDRVRYDPWLGQAPEPPAVPLRLIQTAAPKNVGLGEVVNIGVFFENMLNHTLDEAIVVVEIASQSEYRWSSAGGHFWPQHNHVIWKLGDMAPGSSFAAVVQVRYKWGIPIDITMPVEGMVAAANLDNEYVTYAAHLNYIEVTALSERPLSGAEVVAILAADAELEALYDFTLAQGYGFYGTATDRMLSNGSASLELLLLDPARLGEMVALYRVDDDRYIRRETGQYIAFYDLSGGAQIDLTLGEWTYWGDRAPGEGQGAACSAPSPAGTQAHSTACPDQTWGDCLRNCLMNSVPHQFMLASRASGSSCSACASCSGECTAVCNQCANDMWNEDHNASYSICTKSCADSANWNSQQCTGDRDECYRAPVNESKYSNSEFMLKYECDEASCGFKSQPKLFFCPHGCAPGDSALGVDTRCKELDCDGWNAYLDVNCQHALRAHDPNAMYGPLTAVPGETLDYVVEIENVGEATAYDVFVQSALPVELDDASLQVGQGGMYFSGNRKLFWFIGELAAGGGTSVSSSADVLASTPPDTVILAQAEIHFPSVPEITPTNPVVTLVQEVAAHGQALTTDAGIPLAITLSGSSAGGTPLTYAVTAWPWQGTLTGAPPSLTYTPASESQGLDGFAFTVSDGNATSLPAMVTIEIAAGDDDTPPHVVMVSPEDGATGVRASTMVLYDDLYSPVIWAQFSESLDPESVTGARAVLQRQGGDTVQTTVRYSALANRVYLEVNEPLEPRTEYTVTMDAELTDIAGNALGAAYTWSFVTSAITRRVYLPLVLR